MKWKAGPPAVSKARSLTPFVMFGANSPPCGGTGSQEREPSPELAALTSIRGARGSRCSHFWPSRMEGWGRDALRGVGVSARPRPGMRPARGETNFGGGSEGGQFLRRRRCLWSRAAGAEAGRAHAAGVFASLTCFPKCSGVGMEQRPGAHSSLFRLVRRAVAEWSAVGA